MTILGTILDFYFCGFVFTLQLLKIRPGAKPGNMMLNEDPEIYKKTFLQLRREKSKPKTMCNFC